MDSLANDGEPTILPPNKYIFSRVLRFNVLGLPEDALSNTLIINGVVLTPQACLAHS